MYQIDVQSDGTYAVFQMQPVRIAQFQSADDATAFVALKAGQTPAPTAQKTVQPARAKPETAPIVSDVPAVKKAQPERRLRLEDIVPAEQQQPTPQRDTPGELPSVKSFTAAQRDTFLIRRIAGEAPSDIAESMGFSRRGVAGFLSGAEVKARRFELEALDLPARARLLGDIAPAVASQSAEPSTALVPASKPDVLPIQAALREMRDRELPADVLGRGPVRMGIPPSQAEPAVCTDCGKNFMNASTDFDPKCVRCRD
ncbi:hypothetical protein AN189_12990 [Loktanella sp. 3ANDIMAR09]|uniref:hypothetical protein n=1 Tax=Loktanella sp. 3ANDIMAR09 TaxID=1225657 RepID=UPI0006FD8ACA|nr:hypothetical protein [Loktanella sp. 3ANDIMAR09]KQI67984.1 hypothetical protein AN189_12990 [Loktanella sp. 3ANDIMAR09]